MRELLLFHWPLKGYIDAISVNYRKEIVQDMKTYGYLLPNFIPLFTRYICQNVVHINNMSQYKPYRHGCFAQPNDIHLKV